MDIKSDISKLVSVFLEKNFKLKTNEIEIQNTNILIDTSPDLRNQLYEARCTNIDAVLYTHMHSDHTSGLPDMRAMSLINKKIIPAYMPQEMIPHMEQMYKYIFKGEKKKKEKIIRFDKKENPFNKLLSLNLK